MRRSNEASDGAAKETRRDARSKKKVDGAMSWMDAASIVANRVRHRGIVLS